MGLEQLFEVLLASLILPASVIWVRDWFARRKKSREKTEVHLKNAKALELLIELMSKFRTDLNAMHFAVKDIHEDSAKSKNILDDFISSNQSTVFNIATLSTHVAETNTRAGQIKEDTVSIKAILMMKG